MTRLARTTMIARRLPCTSCGRAVMLVWRARDDAPDRELDRAPDRVVHTERIDSEVDDKCTWPRPQR